MTIFYEEKFHSGKMSLKTSSNNKVNIWEFNFNANLYISQQSSLISL